MSSHKRWDRRGEQGNTLPGASSLEQAAVAPQAPSVLALPTTASDLPPGWFETMAPDGCRYYCYLSWTTTLQRPTSSAPQSLLVPPPPPPTGTVALDTESAMETDREGTGSNGISKHGGNDSKGTETTSDPEVVEQDQGSAPSIDELDEEARMERIVNSRDYSGRDLSPEPLLAGVDRSIIEAAEISLLDHLLRVSVISEEDYVDQLRISRGTWNAHERRNQLCMRCWRKL